MNDVLVFAVCAVIVFGGRWLFLKVFIPWMDRDQPGRGA